MTDSKKVRPVLAQASDGDRPTLKTISRLTGLAVATVSRALHDAPDIGLETKRRVREVAREIGYRPNRAGVRLRTGRTNVISLVMRTDHDVMNHTARLISSTVAELRDTPFHMIVTPYFPDEDPMTPIRYIVESGSADGIIFNQIKPDDARVAYLMERGFPFATHGRSNWREQHAWFDYDNGRYGALGVEVLHRRGRRNLVLVAPPLDQTYAIDMLAGSENAARSLNVAMNSLHAATSDDTNAEIQAALHPLFASDSPPDGVICASPTAAMAAIAQVEAAGLVIGKDVDVFAKEAIPFLRQLRSGVLVVREDVAAAGSFLARAVIDRITNPKRPPMQKLDVPEF